jgi:alpha-L-rhamnosidase
MEGAEMTKELVAPAMYAYSVSLMEKICRALGKTDLENHYQELHRKIQEAYSYEYLMPDGRLKLDYQGMYVLALQMNLVPEDRKELLVNRLVELIHENDGCLDTGFLSIPFLLDVLYENGKREEAFHLLYQEKCPSWMYEIDHGANTIWESWTNITPEGNVTNASYNHFAFGCVGDFIYRRILGLIALEPGYRKVKIQPDISCRLQWAEGSFESINGTISVTWEHCKNKAVMNVILPPGVEAELRLGESILQVESGKHHMEANV